MKPPEVNYKYGIYHLNIRTLQNDGFILTVFFQILAMIEEAAGTRMYECKKISAQKTIEKKEAKLKEIHTVWQTSNRTFDPIILHPFISTDK